MSGRAPSEPVVLVTGGRRGIGLAIARRFHSEGWAIALNDLDEVDLRQALDNFDPGGPSVTIHPTDVGDRDDVEKMVDQILDRHGRLDVLVNNAGEIQFGPLLAYTPEDFESTLRTNVLGTFHCTQSVARRWMELGAEGNIVNISSVSAHQARPGHIAYGASKAAVELLGKVAAMELAPHGIRVNCVAPGGPILTEFVHRLTDQPGFADRVAATVPMGRMGTPDEVAGVVHFLVTEAASYMTGAVVMVDGGVTLGRP